MQSFNLQFTVNCKILAIKILKNILIVFSIWKRNLAPLLYFPTMTDSDDVHKPFNKTTDFLFSFQDF